MKITVKLFATLRTDRFEQDVLHAESGTSVQQMIDMLTIPPDEAAIIFVNGRHADLRTALSDGDTLSIFPPIGGG
ncbi:MAG: molybdopterin converting factor subunit 1 [Nitrospirae bacterium]|nr:MAG: molybdopterin converting factor subunit 1 [Nitrospirota bacterium]